MNRLFFICPECFLENTIRENFDGHHYFLTSLGTVIRKPSYDYATVISKMCEREKIEEICVIQDSQCTFIKDSVSSKYACDCSETSFIHNLFQDNLHQFSSKMDIHTVRETLASINVEHQLSTLEETTVLKEMISSGKIALKGFVLNQHSGQLKKTGERQIEISA
ncbi:MAG: carbonic anhydrase [Cyclobacteriaceae bacterium]